jgi:hypothetical protein
MNFFRQFIGLLIFTCNSCSEGVEVNVEIKDLNKELNYEIPLNYSGSGVYKSSILKNTCPDSIVIGATKIGPYQIGDLYTQCIPTGIKPFRGTYFPPDKHTCGMIIFQVAFYPDDNCIP